MWFVREYGQLEWCDFWGMAMAIKRIVGLIGAVCRGAWRAIDIVRRGILNFVFLAIVVAVMVLVFHSAPGLPEQAVLVIRPAGALVEQATFREPLSLLRSGTVQFEQAVLSELLMVIHAAKNDERVTGLVLETDDLAGADLSKLAELRAAIIAFRTSGKLVLVRGERFTQGQYYLATAADEIELAPDGFVLLNGLSRYVTYFREALDSLGVKIHVFKVGEYKSFSEPFVRNDMSEEDRTASKDLLNGLWHTVYADVLEARKLKEAVLDDYIDRYRDVIAEAQGNAAQAALRTGLVDRLTTRDQWQASLAERFGAEGNSFRKIDFSRYLATLRSQRQSSKDQIAVLVAQGNIVDGQQSGSLVAGDRFVEQIRKARENAAIKAIVVRIDSPGGSAWASELIRRELELTRQAGKPVIASMSSVAASGGYWIACGADQIWASPMTLTGSIGIFGMFPEFSAPMERLGIHVDGVQTSPMAGALDPRRPLTPEVAETMQLAITHGYRRFLEVVSAARDIPVDEVDKVARGRVWTGETALKLGLVDHTGGLDAAISAAAAQADLAEYEIVWPAMQLSPRQRLMQQLLTAAGIDEMVKETAIPANSLPGQVLGQLQRDAAALLDWNDPQHLYTHCLCNSVVP